MNGKWRRLVAPGIASFVTFWLLIAMGVWQLHRMVWKEGIIAQIRHAQVSPPIPLPDHPAPFEKVQIAGSWIAGKAALYGDEVHDSPHGPVPGGELIMGLLRPNGQIVLVDLGWVPQQHPVALANPPLNPSGYLHGPVKAGWFAGADDPGARLFYSLDPARIGVVWGSRNIAPYILIAMGPLPPPGSTLPQPAQDLPTPPNNHYEYALTWFGFAGVLVFQFIFFARERLLRP